MTVKGNAEKGVRALAFDPLAPYEFALGTRSSLVRIFDIRQQPYIVKGFSAQSASSPLPSSGPESGLLQRLCVPDLLREKDKKYYQEDEDVHVSDIRYNSKHEILVNYLGHDLSLFNARPSSFTCMDDCEVVNIEVSRFIAI
jgi:hypothetical protein